MSILGIFKKRHKSYVEATKPEPAEPSKARDDFYAELLAQEKARAEAAALGKNADDMLWGDGDSLTEDQKVSIAKKLVSVNPKPTIVVEDESQAGLVDTEDAAPVGRITGGDGRFADVWSTFAAVNPRILKHFVSRIFIGYPACEILGTHEIINPCCAMPGEDAMASGYQLSCTSDKHAQNDEHIMKEAAWLKEIKKVSDLMGVNKVCTDLALYTRLYGIGVAIPRIELVEGHTMEEPYDPRLVKKGSYKGFSVVDPQDFVWDYDSVTLYNPMSEWYMRPEFLRFLCPDDEGTAQRIHRTWCIVCIFREVGTRMRATYMWGGVPLSQMLYERVFCADKLANEIVALAMSKRTVVKDGNMAAMIAEPNKANHFIQRWNGYRNNSAIAFKEPGEQLTQLETSLADLQPLSAQQYQYAAAIAGIPVTKLLKNVPSGLQATGQYEQDEYEQTLNDIRDQYFKPLLNMHYDLFIRSNYPEREDLKVDIVFNPIQQPKATEVQQIASQRASMCASLLQQGAITVTECRSILKSGESPLFANLSIDTPDLLLKIEKMKDPEEIQKMQMQQQTIGMPGGMPGAAAPGGQDPQQEQQFEQNKTVFQDALKEVLGDDGAQESQEGSGASSEEPSAEEGEQGEQEGEEQNVAH